MIETVPFAGWAHNLRLANGTVEIVVTLDVGPRILAYARPGGPSPLSLLADESGGTGEPEWRMRGGHRLWIAPEHPTATYAPDNAPVAWAPLGPRAVRLTPPVEAATGLQKQLDLSLDDTGTGVRVLHRVTRTGDTPVTLAPWALTVLRPGGLALVPCPPLGSHPRDLLPDRALVLWPYTDLSDPRWRLGPRFLRLQHQPGRGPTKLGLNHRAGWCGYLVEGLFFLKTFPWLEGAVYADRGCNFETYADARILELESLGPLTRLAPGESAEHVEYWTLHEAAGAPAPEAPDEEFARWVEPLLPAPPARTDAR